MARRPRPHRQLAACEHRGDQAAAMFHRLASQRDRAAQESAAAVKGRQSATYEPGPRQQAPRSGGADQVASLSAVLGARSQQQLASAPHPVRSPPFRGPSI